VILVDANLLIYAHVEDLPQHAAAHRWLDQQLNELPRVGLPWPSLLAFVRLVINPRIFERPLTLTRAWAQVDRWLAHGSVWVPLPTPQHSAVLGRLIGEMKTDPKLVPDAHLAALAIEHNLTLCTSDRDFQDFQGLRWSNPLVEQDVP
jgi:toxin-antitoxin system PIN domain toxin